MTASPTESRAASRPPALLARAQVQFAIGLLCALACGCGTHALRPVDRALGAVVGVAAPAPDAEHANAVIARLSAGIEPRSVALNFGSQVLDELPELNLVLLRTPIGSTARSFALRLEQDPRVQYAETNKRVENAESAQSTVAFSEVWRSWSDVADQTALARIGVAAAQRLATGEGVRVALLDTGIDLDHPALAAAIELPGIEPGVTVDAGDDRAEHTDSNQDGIVDGSLGHGSHVAGIVHSVAPQARLIAVRVLDSDGQGDLFRVLQGLVLAVQRDAQVLNLSLALSAPSQALTSAIEFARQAGCVVVAAAGNASANSVTFPASLPGVVAVAATDAADQKASFSDFGSEVALAAPGEGILSTWHDGGFARWSGTSMASPFVSGTAALLYSRLGARTTDAALKTEMLLRAGAEPLARIDPVYGTELGAGRLNAAESVALLVAAETDTGEVLVLRRTAR